MSTDPLAGIVSLTIDGNAVDVVSDAKFSSARKKNEILSGQSGAYQGYKSMPKNGYIGAKVRIGGAFSARDYSEMTGVTVIIVLASGASAFGSNLIQTEDVEVDTTEGTLDVKFEGLVEED